MNSNCIWVRAFDGHFNISCPTGHRANGNFKNSDDIEGKTTWEFTYCPYCGGKIEIGKGKVNRQ